LQKGIRYLLSALLPLLLCSGVCWAIAITVTGNWAETIDASDLQGGPGSNLISTYESASNVGVVDINAGNWWVYVEKTDSTWHANLHLYVKRTSDGSGSGTISGGTNYQEIDTSQLFFSGSDDRSNVNLQLKLDGVSIQVPPAIYTTTIYYTISDSG
jgi:hypothetical protein